MTCGLLNLKSKITRKNLISFRERSGCAELIVFLLLQKDTNIDFKNDDSCAYVRLLLLHGKVDS